MDTSTGFFTLNQPTSEPDSWVKNYWYLDTAQSHLVSPSHIDFVLTRTYTAILDLKTGTPLKAYFYSLDSLRVTRIL